MCKMLNFGNITLKRQLDRLRKKIF